MARGSRLKWRPPDSGPGGGGSEGPWSLLPTPPLSAKGGQGCCVLAWLVVSGRQEEAEDGSGSGWTPGAPGQWCGPAFQRCQPEPQACRKPGLWGAGVPAPFLSTLTSQGREGKTGLQERGAKKTKKEMPLKMIFFENCNVPGYTNTQYLLV